MSKTDSTRPLRVKAMDRPTDLTESHDHAEGPCDLPAKPTGPLTCLWGGDATTRCYWTASHAFMVSPEAHCNAPCHSKKRDDYAIKEAAARRTANRKAEHDVLVDLAEHGIYDDLGDIETPWAVDRRWAAEYGGYEDEVAQLAALRDRIAASDLMPETSLVVDVRAAYVYDCCEDCGMRDPDGYRVEVLHNDGRREVLRFEQNPWWTGTSTDPVMAGATP